MTYQIALYIVMLLAVALGGCATYAADGTTQDPIAGLSKIIAVDLDAADAIAVQHNDVLGHACYPVLKQYLGTGTPTTDQIMGVVSAFEKARVTRLAVEGGLSGSNLAPLQLACGGLLLSEREFILRQLEKHHWNVTQTAQAIGLSRASLHAKMKEYQ